MLNLEPETARLVSLFVRSSRRERVLEIGTSNGYSTLWLAWSVRSHNGRVISIDRDADKQELAEANLHRAGLSDVVELMLGDATEIVCGLDGPFDCVFFDADRVSAPEQLHLLLPKLRDDVLLMADNALSHPDEIAGYLAALQALPDFERLVIPVGKGLSVAYVTTRTT
jgi:predicted O-methyltransferase YrrM